VVRNMPARLNDSFQASERDASRLQCSVERICSRIAGDASVVGVSPGRGAGDGSGPIPVPAVTRSNDIVHRLGRGTCDYGAAGISDTKKAFMPTGLIVRP